MSLNNINVFVRTLPGNQLRGGLSNVIQISLSRDIRQHSSPYNCIFLVYFVAGSAFF